MSSYADSNLTRTVIWKLKNIYIMTFSTILVGVIIYLAVVISVAVSIPPISFLTLFLAIASTPIRKQTETMIPRFTKDLPIKSIRPIVGYTLGYSIILAYIGFLFSISFTLWVSIVSSAKFNPVTIFIAPALILILLFTALARLEVKMSSVTKRYAHDFVIEFLENKHKLYPRTLESYSVGAVVIILGFVFAFVTSLIIYYFAAMIGLAIA